MTMPYFPLFDVTPYLHGYITSSNCGVPRADGLGGDTHTVMICGCFSRKRNCASCNSSFSAALDSDFPFGVLITYEPAHTDHCRAQRWNGTLMATGNLAHVPRWTVPNPAITSWYGSSQ